MALEDRKHLGFSSFYCLLFQFNNRKSMFPVPHSDINSCKSGLLHLTDQPYCKKGRSAKVKDGIINLILRNYLIDRFKYSLQALQAKMWRGPSCKLTATLSSTTASTTSSSAPTPKDILDLNWCHCHPRFFEIRLGLYGKKFQKCLINYLGLSY